MNLRCAEIDELLGAYTLDALEGDELCAVHEHLAECRKHDVEVAALREISARLPLSVQPLATPPDLGRRLMAAFDEAVAQGSAPPTPVQMPARRATGLLRAPAFAYGLAAALLVIAVGLGVWNYTLQSSADPGIVVREAASGGMQLRVTYLEEQKLALVGIQMPSLPPNQVYQGWQITDAGPVSLGLLQNNGLTAVSVDLAGASAIAVSVEPAGGSPAPTTTPVIVSDF